MTAKEKDRMAIHETLSSPEARKPRVFYGYVVVGIATFVLLLMAGTWFCYGVFFKPLTEEFGWSRAMTSGAHSMFLIVMGLSFMVTGRLADRFGPRIVLSICAAILGIGYLLMSRITAIWQLYLFWGLIAAMGQSGGLVPMMSTVARWFVKRRGLMTGIVVGGGGLGNMVMPPIAAHLIDSYGWRTAYITFGVAILALVIGVAQFLKRDPGKVGQLPDGESTASQHAEVSQIEGDSRREALRTSRFWMLTIIYFSLGFFMHSVLVHIVPHATDTGIAPITASSVLACLGALNATGRVAIGGAGDRMGNRRAAIFSFALALASLLWLQIASELWMMYVFAVVFGFAIGGMVALESPLVAEQFGLQAHGGILGMTHFAGVGVGGALGTFLSGKLYDQTGNYHMIFIVLAGISAVGLLLSILLKPPQQKKK